MNAGKATALLSANVKDTRASGLLYSMGALFAKKLPCAQHFSGRLYLNIRSTNLRVLRQVDMFYGDGRRTRRGFAKRLRLHHTKIEYRVVKSVPGSDPDAPLRQEQNISTRSIA